MDEQELALYEQTFRDALPRGAVCPMLQHVLAARGVELVAEVRRLQHCSQCGAFQEENICLGCD